MTNSLRPALSGSLSWTVPTHRTVPYLLPKSPELTALPKILATGYLVGVQEWICVRTVAGHIEAGAITLAVHIDVSHQAPPPAGSTVTLTAELTAVEGRVVVSGVDAADVASVVTRGTHRRAVNDPKRFEGRLDVRATQAAVPTERPA